MKSDVNKIFAKNMRLRRKQLKLSQEKLGELSGLHRTYIGGIEQFLRNPSLASMEKIAKALSIDLSLLANKDFEDIVTSEYAICHYVDGEYSVKPIDFAMLNKKQIETLNQICKS